LALEWWHPYEVVFGTDDIEKGKSRSIRTYDNILEKYQRAKKMALAGGYDALFTVEADMILPSDTLLRLAQVDADVAYGLYASRHRRHQWLAATQMSEGRGVWLSDDVQTAQAAWGKVIETQGVGMGCTLIRRHVLETVPFRRAKGSFANDWYFSLDLKAKGFVQKHDLGVICGHIAKWPSQRIIWPSPKAPGMYREQSIVWTEADRRIMGMAKKGRKDMNYIALVRIWHSGEKKFCEAGEKVSLAHLDAGSIERLMERGVVELAPEPKTVAKVVKSEEVT
jgi:hypothetical protein